MTAEGETTAPEDRLSLRRLALRRRAFASSLVVAAATTVITGCAHAVGGGVAPDALLLLAAFVTTLLVLAPVLGARGSAPRRVVAVTIAQLLQHGVYSLPRPSASAHAGPAAGHHDTGLHDAALGPILVEHAHAAMPLAHVAAGVITLWLLRAVPRAVAAVLEAMSLRLAAAALAWTPPRVRRAASVSAVSPAHRAALDVLRSALVRRGPPALAV
ncbi:hypothetical protein [Agrococcus jenensis]|uniref:Uncharacterized protein n=1 Tax=Agrococcus jenensis TaxID=46353 RepID=A0A3N2AP85_9MICO|nr:hypothetical protein [Agrococcus jenensis]ROR64853.1 hypothetical protein EDD26_0204 [Agrococcus jenensis]